MSTNIPPETDNATVPPKDRTCLPYTNAGFDVALTETGWDMRFDNRARRLDVAPPWLNTDPKARKVWVPLTDPLEGKMRDDMRTSFSLVYETSNQTRHKEWCPTERDLKGFVDSYGYDHEVDSWAEDYLRTLPEWDGVNRVDNLVAYCWPDYRDTNPELSPEHADMIAAWIGRYLFLAPIQRAFEPGSDLREVPVLIGPQRGGKSSLVKWLACGNREWFTDAVALDADRKTNDEATAGKVFVEIAEMVGNRRADIERMKVRLTSHQDGGQRAAYAKFVRSYDRRWVAVGTANDTGSGVLPNDPSGNSRFVALRVGVAARQPWGLPVEHRDQCFVEALFKYTHHDVADKYRGWGSARLPAALHEAQQVTNKVHTSANPLIEDALAGLTCAEYTPKELYEDVWSAMPEGARPSERVVAMAATAAGWTRKRVYRAGSKQVRVWVNPSGGA